VKAYEQAAARGLTDAHVNLGNILADHLHRPEDAVASYQLAAEHGDTDAMVNIGLLLKARL
jgi:TPR repeat protein